MVFEYDLQTAYTQSIDIVDMGNMCLRCHKSSSMGDIFYYLCTKTVMGKTSLITYGPVVKETDIVLDGFLVNYKKFDYKERQIIKETKSFINDPKKEIFLVEEILESIFWEDFPNLKCAFE